MTSLGHIRDGGGAAGHDELGELRLLLQRIAESQLEHSDQLAHVFELLRMFAAVHADTLDLIEEIHAGTLVAADGNGSDGDRREGRVTIAASHRPAHARSDGDRKEASSAVRAEARQARRLAHELAKRAQAASAQSVELRKQAQRLRGRSHAGQDELAVRLTDAGSSAHQTVDALVRRAPVVRVRA